MKIKMQKMFKKNKEKKNEDAFKLMSLSADDEMAALSSEGEIL